MRISEKPKLLEMAGANKMVGIALGVLWTGLGGIFYLRYKERKKIITSEYYKTSMALLRSFPPAKEKLGESIYEYPLDVFFNDGISITPFTSRVTAGVWGAKNSGILYSWASRDETYEGWRIERLDLEIKDQTERISVYRDNSKFPRAQMLDPRLLNKPKTEADDPLAYVDMQGNIKKQPVGDDC